MLKLKRSGESSSGRTADSESVNEGSNPSSPASFRLAHSPVGLVNLAFLLHFLKNTIYQDIVIAHIIVEKRGRMALYWG